MNETKFQDQDPHSDKHGICRILCRGVCFTGFVIIALGLLIPLFRFHLEMRLVQPWSDIRFIDEVTNYDMETLTDAAEYTVKQPEWRRKIMIWTYQLPVTTCYRFGICLSKYEGIPQPMPSASKMYLLLRIMFDVPEVHPSEDIKYFGSWDPYSLIPETELRTNLLWPVGYSELGDIELKAAFGIGLDPYYDCLGEYQYFRKRFGFREFD